MDGRSLARSRARSSGESRREAPHETRARARRRRGRDAEPLPAHERARILDAVARLLDERQEEAAQTISAEAGKPLKAARVEAQRAVSTYTFAAVEARRLAGEVVPMDASPAGEGKLALTLRLPIGIVGAISPFNFPLNLVAHKIAPALAAGCAVVLKPASATPLSAFFLAELEEEAGLPPGWINVVAGSASAIGDVLVDDERVKLITFTGSGDVGWGTRGARAPQARQARARQRDAGDRLRRRARRTPRRSSPRTRSRSPGRAASRCSGSSCIDDAWDEFVAEFVPKVEALQVGDPADESTDVGPVISDGERERILEWIRESKGEVLTGGDDDRRRPDPADRDREPGPDDKVQCEEVFGPVVTLTRVASLDEAIEQANATRYGLQAAIFTTRPAAPRSTPRAGSSSAA